MSTGYTIRCKKECSKCDYFRKYIGAKKTEYHCYRPNQYNNPKVDGVDSNGFVQPLYLLKSCKYAKIKSIKSKAKFKKVKVKKI